MRSGAMLLMVVLFLMTQVAFSADSPIPASKPDFTESAAKSRNIWYSMDAFDGAVILGLFLVVLLLLGLKYPLIWTLLSVITLACGAACLAIAITAVVKTSPEDWQITGGKSLIYMGWGTGLAVGGIVLLILSLVLFFRRSKSRTTVIPSAAP